MKRRKKMVSYALEPSLLARLDSWLAKQELPPSKTSVMELSLKEYLDRQEAKA